MKYKSENSLWDSLPERLRSLYSEAVTTIGRNVILDGSCQLTKIDGGTCLLYDLGDGYDCEFWIDKYYRRPFNSVTWNLCIWKGNRQIMERHFGIKFDEVMEHIENFEKSDEEQPE